MNTIRAEIEFDNATSMVAALRRGLTNKAALSRAGAEGMLPTVQAHLRVMADTNHNAFGVRSSFWNLMLAGTHAGTDDLGGFVSTPAPVALRAFGGTVTPKVSKYLAIPARTEAYGNSPKDFSDLRFVMLNGKAALIQTDLAPGKKTRGKRTKDEQGRLSIAAREQGGMVFFWLVESATIAPDPDVLPSDALLQASAKVGLTTYVNLLIERSLA